MRRRLLCGAAVWVIAAPLFSLGAEVFPALQEISSPLVIRPEAAPHPTYVTSEILNTEDARLAALVAEEWPDLHYSPGLARAAQAYAEATVVLGQQELPQLALNFLINRSGCVETDAAGVTVSTSESSTVDVMEQLAAVIEASPQPFTHVGMARTAYASPPFAWRWTVVLSRREIELQTPLPATVSPGASMELCFRLAGHLNSPKVVLLPIGGGIQEIAAPAGDDGWFRSLVPAGEQPGTLWLQVLAASQSGSTIPAHFPLTVGSRDGGSVRAVWRGRSDPDEGFITSFREAEALMLALVNEDRRRLGLHPLSSDERLGDVARAHSEDMLINQFFAHVSPTHGGLRPRLRAAAYRARHARENISKAKTVHGAQTALWQSPSHRANILAADVSLLGVGITRDWANPEEPSWIVTQIFADPFAEATATEIKQSVVTAIKARRSISGLFSLRSHVLLDEAARALARTASTTGKLDQLQFRDLHRSLADRGLKARTLNAERLTTSSPEAVTLSELVDDVAFNLYGVGVHADRTEQGAPIFTAVVLYARTTDTAPKVDAGGAQ